MNRFGIDQCPPRRSSAGADRGTRSNIRRIDRRIDARSARRRAAGRHDDRSQHRHRLDPDHRHRSRRPLSRQRIAARHLPDARRACRGSRPRRQGHHADRSASSSSGISALGLQGVQESVTVTRPGADRRDDEERGRRGGHGAADRHAAGRRPVGDHACRCCCRARARTRRARSGLAPSVGLGGLSTAGTNYIVDGMNNMIPAPATRAKTFRSRRSRSSRSSSARRRPSTAAASAASSTSCDQGRRESAER